MVAKLGDSLTFYELKVVYGNNLKYYRRKQNLTQEQLAEKTNTDTTFISRVENGKSGVSFQTMLVFANILNTEIYKFFIRQ